MTKKMNDLEIWVEPQGNRRSFCSFLLTATQTYCSKALSPRKMYITKCIILRTRTNWPVDSWYGSRPHATVHLDTIWPQRMNAAAGFRAQTQPIALCPCSGSTPSCVDSIFPCFLQEQSVCRSLKSTGKRSVTVRTYLPPGLCTQERRCKSVGKETPVLCQRLCLSRFPCNTLLLHA